MFVWAEGEEEGDCGERAGSRVTADREALQLPKGDAAVVEEEVQESLARGFLAAVPSVVSV